MVEKSEGRRAGSSLRLKTIEKLAGRLYIQYRSAAGIEDGGFHFIRDVSRVFPLGTMLVLGSPHKAFIRNCMFLRRIREQGV